MEVSGQLHALAAFPPAHNTGIHWTEGWLGPSAGVEEFWEEKKTLALPGIRTSDRPTS